jgi:hypothetical protein
MNDKKKNPKGTANSDKKNVVSVSRTNPKYGTLKIDVDTSGFSGGARRFGATKEFTNNAGTTVKKELTTNRRGAKMTMLKQQGKSKRDIQTVLPQVGKIKTTVNPPLPKRKNN